MTYVLKTSSRNKSRFPLPLTIVAIVIILLGIFYFAAPSLLSSVFISIVRPFWNIENTARYGDSFVNVSDLMKENEELRQTLLRNEGRYLQTDLLRKENEELKKLVGREAAGKFVLAQILKKPPLSAYDIFILDVGNSNGVKVGNRVYALGEIPLGEVVEATGNTSKVKLYSTAGEKFTVFMGPKNIEAIATGRGGGSFEVSIPRDTDIAIGSDVIAPSIHNNFIGKVQDIVSEPSHPFATLLFSQPLNIYELRWLEVDVESSSSFATSTEQ